jgi:glycosyltransferase involved in cell wall biosynthesis
MYSEIPLVACSGGLDLGGSTTFLLNLGRGLRELGFPFHVVTIEEESEMAADFAAAGIPVHSVPRRGTIFEDRIHLSYLATAPLRPKAVLSCLGSESFELLRVVPPGTARIGIIQSDDPRPYRMTRYFAPWLDAMVGVSQSICANLRSDSTFSKVHVEQIPYGISFGPPVARPSRDTTQPIKLIYVGRVIEEQKRVSRLIELSRLLAARGISHELTFVGTGPDMPKTQEAVKSMKEVRLLGEISNSEVPALLRSQDIFVLLSDYEGLPLSLLEAMGQGVVPVISDLESGIREVVSDRVGIRVPVGDVAAAAAAIVSLAENPQKLAQLSAWASASVRGQYSAARMAERYINLVGHLAKSQVDWPDDVRIRPPMMQEHEWLYRGLPRIMRRFVQRIKPG